MRARIHDIIEYKEGRKIYRGYVTSIEPDGKIMAIPYPDDPYRPGTGTPVLWEFPSYEVHSFPIGEFDDIRKLTEERKNE